jgi:serine/threonine protein kinase
MGFPSLNLRMHAPRTLLQIRWRIALVLFVAALCHQQHLFHTSRQSLAAKCSPTEFDSTHLDSHHKFRRRDKDANFQDRLIANREHWKTIGNGWEGKVFAYKDSVIKTFTPGRSPFRNCAPGETNEKWPTEIAASLRFGGHNNNNNITNAESMQGDDANEFLDGFLSVKTYFEAAIPPSQVPEWHLVTPLLKGGNLEKLAKKTSQKSELNTTRRMDTHYRPAFENLLSNLQRLHEARYCHDDIKPTNVFVANDTHWVLGDLGNLRHVSHPYHSSRLWTDNKQLSDCRANDAIRALKSYLQFIRSATRDKDAFDSEFYMAEEPLSRMFWKAWADAPNMSAALLREISVTEYAEKSGTRPDGDLVQVLQAHAPSSGVFKKAAVRKAVDSLLETRMGEKFVRWWGMAGVLGVPSNEVCGF